MSAAPAKPQHTLANKILAIALSRFNSVRCFYSVKTPNTKFRTPPATGESFKYIDEGCGADLIVIRGRPTFRPLGCAKRGTASRRGSSGLSDLGG